MDPMRNTRSSWQTSTPTTFMPVASMYPLPPVSKIPPTIPSRDAGVALGGVDPGRNAGARRTAPPSCCTPGRQWRTRPFALGLGTPARHRGRETARAPRPSARVPAPGGALAAGAERRADTSWALVQRVRTTWRPDRRDPDASLMNALVGYPMYVPTQPRAATHCQIGLVGGVSSDASATGQILGINEETGAVRKSTWLTSSRGSCRSASTRQSRARNRFTADGPRGEPPAG